MKILCSETNTRFVDCSLYFPFNHSGKLKKIERHNLFVMSVMRQVVLQRIVLLLDLIKNSRKERKKITFICEISIRHYFVLKKNLEASSLIYLILVCNILHVGYILR